jgi:putative nucleotidyltransferase with HDIG domain
MTSASSSGGLDRLRRQALNAARGLAAGEQTLVAVLRELEADQGRATQTYRAVVRSLAAALEARDSYAGGHSDAVHGLSLAVARRLGLEGDELELVSTTALLHDIGKICTPDAILHKPRKLSEDEWETIREHSAIGERILRPLPGLDGVADAVRHGHEHWDGSGYPDGLLGEAIPLASRIVLACDAFHALASDRPYREALPRGRSRRYAAARAGISTRGSSTRSSPRSEPTGLGRRAARHAPRARRLDGPRRAAGAARGRRRDLGGSSHRARGRDRGG